MSTNKQGTTKQQTVEQHITAMVTLSGRQHTTISSQGDGGAGSHVQIACNSVLITLYDRRAVHAYGALWNTKAGAIYAHALPEHRPILPSTGQSRVAVSVVGHGSHRGQFAPMKGVLAVKIGSIRWMVLDQAAYRSQVDLWDKVALLAQVLLPDVFVPTA